jgi:hypothetical protein
MLAEIVEGLASTRFEEQDAAIDRLERLSKQGFSIKDRIEALRAATRSFPSRKYDWRDSAADLIDAATESPKPEYIHCGHALFQIKLNRMSQVGLENQSLGYISPSSVKAEGYRKVCSACGSAKRDAVNHCRELTRSKFVRKCSIPGIYVRRAQIKKRCGTCIS